MTSSRKNLLILFFTMIVVMLGFGMIIPIMPFYVKSFGASGSALGALMATYGLLQFLTAPFWGGLSDYYGRKPVLVIGVLGNAIAQVLFGLSTELWMLFAARALAGLLSSATLPTAMAYIGDSTSRENRGGGMGMIGAAMGIGMVLGPGLGGTLASSSLALPFFLASALSLLALALILIFLPESKPREATFQEARPPLRGPEIGAMFEALSGPVGVLLALALLLSFGLTNFESIFGLYAAQQYAYDPRQVGLVLTVIGLTSAIMQGAVTGPATRRFGEVLVIRVTLIATSLGFVLLTLPQTFPQVLLACSFLVFSNSMISPAVSALISKRTDRPQGVTMGVTNSFMSLGRIIGPLWAGFIFDLGPNLPYLTGALIMFAGFVISITLLHNQADDSPVDRQPHSQRL